jgi:short-subunit dehydrogenase
MPRSSYSTALITGASSGLGAEYARRLAAAGTDLILTARRRDRLEELARELRDRHGVAVEVIEADLAQDDGIGLVERRIAEDPALDLLVNNAGFGGRGGFVRGEIGDHMNMVRVHVDATVRLTRAALPGMIARGRGGIINVASVAAFSPFSGAMYSGTKSFLAMFSGNLQTELRGKGVFVQALCPGMTHTEFHEVADIDKAIVPKLFWMTAGEVVRISLRRLGHGAICVPGWKNKVVAFLMRCPLTAAGVRAVGRSKAARKKADR